MVKKKARNIREEQNGTIGGPPTNPKLTMLEDRLIAAVGLVSIESVVGALELFGETFSKYLLNSIFYELMLSIRC